MNKCIDCGKELKYCKAKRCRSCAKREENNPSYIDGRSLKPNYCIDCGKEINYRSMRCPVCAKKGRNNKRYNSNASCHKLNFCFECGKEISPEAKRCQSCSNRIRAKKLWKNGVYDNRSVCYPSIKYKKKNGGIIYLDSSWELKVAQNLDRNNINWIKPMNKNGHTFQWIDEKGKSHIYHPDFYLLDYNIYLDPHWNGFYEVKDDFDNKINRVEKQNNIKVLVLNENELNWKYIKRGIKLYKESETW